MDELRSPLVEALEKLTSDLVVGQYDDPHLGFVVLLHPDRHPSVVSLSPAGAHNLTRLVAEEANHSDKMQPKDEASARPFEWSDCAAAQQALADCDSAGWSFNYRKDPDQTLGQHVDETMRSRWERTRDSELKNALEKAAFEESHKAQCPNCSRRFTERGLAQHRARSSWKGCRTGAAEPAADRPPAPRRTACPLPCSWTGLADELPHHMETIHAGRYIVG